MTQDEIIEMARKVGLVIDGNQSGLDDLEAFAKLVAAKAFQNGYEKGIAGFNEAVLEERKACAKFFDDHDTNIFWGSDAARFIRARGKQA